jgi:uncharacterized protein
MENDNVKNCAERRRCGLLPALCIMLGLVFVGLMLPRAFRVLRSFDRTVTVRGVSEREVPADKVIWPIAYRAVGNDLTSLNSEIESKNSVVLSFLKDGGIADAAISVAAPAISDAYAQEYSTPDRKYRYVATCVVTVATDEVDKVLDLMNKQTYLLDRGIVLVSESWNYKAEFSFEGLNDIKPEMIEEATENARLSGDKFAKDSHSRLGKIRTANQGVFSITDRDSTTPQIKKVRVVTTIVYNLSR